MTHSRQILSLYKTLLRRGQTLVYSDKQYYAERIRSEFKRNKHLNNEREIKRCLQKADAFMKKDVLL